MLNSHGVSAYYEPVRLGVEVECVVKAINDGVIRGSTLLGRLANATARR